MVGLNSSLVVADYKVLLVLFVHITCYSILHLLKVLHSFFSIVLTVPLNFGFLVCFFLIPFVSLILSFAIRYIYYLKL